MTDLAIYDMDRTVTKYATYTPFLLHCARRRQPWRLALTPLAAASMLAYVARVIDRSRLKEINHALMLGRHLGAHQLAPLVESFADATIASNICPGALRQIAQDKADGRRLVLATASYRLYAKAIADRLGFDDFRSNGLLLPASSESALRMQLPLHRGPHRDYNSMVSERVGQIEGDWSRMRLVAPEIALDQALMRVDLLQRALRRRLLTPERARMRLNRRDPLGTGLDFAELDALADALWAGTSGAALSPLQRV